MVSTIQDGLLEGSHPDDPNGETSLRLRTGMDRKTNTTREGYRMKNAEIRVLLNLDAVTEQLGVMFTMHTRIAREYAVAAEKLEQARINATGEDNDDK